MWPLLTNGGEIFRSTLLHAGGCGLTHTHTHTTVRIHALHSLIWMEDLQLGIQHWISITTGPGAVREDRPAFVLRVLNRFLQLTSTVVLREGCKVKPHSLASTQASHDFSFAS